MILLDSCAVLDILFATPDADPLSEFLDGEQARGVEIVFLPLNLLESSAVMAVRFKEGNAKAKDHDFDHYLERLAEFQTMPIQDDLTPDVIADAARIKIEHAASMVDCYLIANACRRGAEVVTADREILSFAVNRAKFRKITKRYAAIKWRR